MVVLVTSIFGVTPVVRSQGTPDRFALIDASAIGETVDHPLRPRFHFTPREHWMNDPNGLVHDGERYHVFFQHNPLGREWGNMTWGHATSDHLVRFEQRPHALLPYRVDDRWGTVFSGTVIVDHNDSLGRRVGDTPTLAAFFTFAERGDDPTFHQSLAYSTDRGETWTLHDDGRPVIENQGLDPTERDPKIFWDGENERWGLVLWVSKDPGTLRFFASKNLTDWTVVGDLERDWAYECPDLFHLALDGDGDVKCVLMDASGDYEVGRLKDGMFVSEQASRDFGGGTLYASQVFNNHPRFAVVQMSWMRGMPDPGQDHSPVPWNNQMSFPVRLRLHDTDAGARLAAEPVDAIRPLIEEEFWLNDPAVGTEPRQWIEHLPPNFDADFRLPTGDVLVDLRLGSLPLVWSGAERSLRIDGKMEALINDAPTDDEGFAVVRLLVDRMSVEVFADEGRTYVANYFVGDPAGGPATISADRPVTVPRAVVRRLSSEPAIR